MIGRREGLPGRLPRRRYLSVNQFVNIHFLLRIGTMAEVIDAEIIDLESDSDGDDPPPPTVKPTVKHCPRCTLENAIGAKRCEACDLAFERPAPCLLYTSPSPRD